MAARKPSPQVLTAAALQYPKSKQIHRPREDMDGHLSEIPQRTHTRPTRGPLFAYSKDSSEVPHRLSDTCNSAHCDVRSRWPQEEHLSVSAEPNWQYTPGILSSQKCRTDRAPVPALPRPGETSIEQLRSESPAFLRRRTG